jgi:peptide-methionine (R)-S-oxide reductase
VLKLRKSDAEWRDHLSDKQYYVCRERGTEQAFTGAYWDTRLDGVYLCACCDKQLFDANDKYDSGSGWPSFVAPVRSGVVSQIVDHSYNMTRLEVVCVGCDAHLGHVFDDGPQPSGLRYCINSLSLNFVPR